jgi:hypothetical protein
LEKNNGLRVNLISILRSLSCHNFQTSLKWVL